MKLRISIYATSVFQRVTYSSRLAGMNFILHCGSSYKEVPEVKCLLERMDVRDEVE